MLIHLGKITLDQIPEGNSSVFIPDNNTEFEESIKSAEKLFLNLIYIGDFMHLKLEDCKDHADLIMYHTREICKIVKKHKIDKFIVSCDFIYELDRFTKFEDK